MRKYYPVVVLKFRSRSDCFIHIALILRKIRLFAVYKSHVRSKYTQKIPNMKFQDGGQSRIIKHSFFVARSILVALYNNAVLGTYAIDRKI